MSEHFKITIQMIVMIGYVFMFGLLPIKAEEIFRWVDERGDIFFSNIEPPLGDIEYSKKTTLESPPLSGSSVKLPTSDLPEAPDIKRQEMSGVDHRTIKKVLQKQIEEGKRSIKETESLLKINSNNRILRQHLFRKRIRLLENINRLNSL